MKNLNETEVEAVNGALGAVLVIVGPIGPLIAAGKEAEKATDD